MINSIGTVNYSRHVEIKIHSSPRNSESNGILSHFVVFSGKTNLDLPVFSTRFVIQTPPAGVVISGVCCLNPVLKSAWPSACLSRKVTQQLQLQNKRLLVAEFFICDFRMKSPYSYFALYALCISLISQETLVKANQYDPHLFPSEGPFHRRMIFSNHRLRIESLVWNLVWPSSSAKPRTSLQLLSAEHAVVHTQQRRWKFYGNLRSLSFKR